MMHLCLASGSATRRQMLKDAGLSFTVDAAKVDEAALKAALLQEGAGPRDIAAELADLKARRISSRHPEHLVLGADQTLSHDGTLFDKPESLNQARAQLTSLRGSTHHLYSAAVIYLGGRPIWRHIGSADLTMRSFSQSFLDDYIMAQGDDLLATVGCYKIEKQGVQLFSKITGDYFSILGLPLLEVLDFLRLRGVVAE